MGYITCTEVGYTTADGRAIFDDLTFRVSPGEHVGLVGANGVGKSTLLRLLIGQARPDEGHVAVGGTVAYMPQSVAAPGSTATVREMLMGTAPADIQEVGTELQRLAARLAEGRVDDALAYAEGLERWGMLGGYEIEARWDRVCRSVLGAGFSEIADRPLTTLSGGEGKRLFLEALFASDYDVLLLDEPDNFLDIPAKRELEDALCATRKTVLVVSHDRALLRSSVGQILTLEGDAGWIHHGSYASYPEARERRNEQLGDAVKRWHEEERRLYRLVKTFKERARYSDSWARKADAAESRWRRFADPGPPPPPIKGHEISIRLPEVDAARRMLRISDLAIDGMVRAFSDEIYAGERVGVIGPNGSGKTHLMRVLAEESDGYTGEVDLGARARVGYFRQSASAPPDQAKTPILDTAGRLTGNTERAMAALARYGLAGQARLSPGAISGGQRARFEILCLELRGTNLLLLDEPTDNLDIASGEALENALAPFDGCVIAVSHDREFLRHMTRYLMLLPDGDVLAIPDYDTALACLSDPGSARGTRLVKALS
ncbi:MAG: ABC-F family ATP-binding cassette domain-containing protein [Solirubrobacteraceae bacterium]|nr:ABC-F family ATP-binding cassette domain-containing protein [Solirubrobacteraceae bacterium]